jgi:hypothetical protein
MMSSASRPSRAELIGLAQDLCAVIERGDLTRAESLEVLTGLQALLELLSVPPRDQWQ